jgi:hypothetical protein
MGSGLLYVLGDDGQPRRVDDVLVWAAWFETHDRTIAHDHVGAVRVSTVFLAFDHAYGDGPPVLWETMIFGGDSWEDLGAWRYTSRAAALAGHAKALGLVRATLDKMKSHG